MFNIFKDPWLPIIDENGDIQLVGMRDYLVNAHRYKASAENSEFPILRILQERFAGTLISDIFGATTEVENQLIEAGQFNEEEIDSYIEKCKKNGIFLTYSMKKNLFYKLIKKPLKK